MFNQRKEQDEKSFSKTLDTMCKGLGPVRRYGVWELPRLRNEDHLATFH
jgi:hypothetical protein